MRRRRQIVNKLTHYSVSTRCISSVKTCLFTDEDAGGEKKKKKKSRPVEKHNAINIFRSDNLQSVIQCRKWLYEYLCWRKGKEGRMNTRLSLARVCRTPRSAQCLLNVHNQVIIAQFSVSVIAPSSPLNYQQPEHHPKLLDGCPLCGRG